MSVYPYFFKDLVADAQLFQFKIPKSLREGVSYYWFLHRTKTLCDYDDWIEEILADGHDWRERNTLDLFKIVASHLYTYHQHQTDFIGYINIISEEIENDHVLPGKA